MTSPSTEEAGPDVWLNCFLSGDEICPSTVHVSAEAGAASVASHEDETPEWRAAWQQIHYVDARKLAALEEEVAREKVANRDERTAWSEAMRELGWTNGTYSLGDLRGVIRRAMTHLREAEAQRDAAEKRASAAESALASYPPRSAVGSGTHWVQQEELDRERAARVAAEKRAAELLDEADEADEAGKGRINAKTEARLANEALDAERAAHAATRRELEEARATATCEHCGTRLNGNYHMAAVPGSPALPLEYEADRAHTAERCRDALRSSLSAAEVRERALVVVLREAPATSLSTRPTETRHPAVSWRVSMPRSPPPLPARRRGRR